MKREFCIFNNKKDCTSCGECEKCDLNSNKQCNNCGKCLEMQGFDMKGIKIDDIIEDDKESKEYEVELENNSELKDESEEVCDNYIDGYESNNDEDSDAWNDNIEYIDDIDGLSELMEDEDKFKEYAHEEFPGLIRFKERKKGL